MRTTSDCPACKKPTLLMPLERNPFSKYVKVKICPKCARDEQYQGNFWRSKEEKWAQKRERKKANDNAGIRYLEQELGPLQ